MHGINSNKIWSYLLIFYFLFFSSIATFKFNRTTDDLIQIENEGMLSTEEGLFFALDIAETNDRTSIYYLLKNDENKYFLLTATRFPFLPKYALSQVMPLSEKEIFKTSDFFYKITILHSNSELYLQAKKHISKSVYLMFFLLFVVIVNIINNN